MADKAFYKSKTFWINIVGTLLTILSLSDITTLLPAKYAPFLAGAVAVLNIILRSLKSEGQGGLVLTQTAADASKASPAQPEVKP